MPYDIKPALCCYLFSFFRHKGRSVRFELTDDTYDVRIDGALKINRKRGVEHDLLRIKIIDMTSVFSKVNSDLISSCTFADAQSIYRIRVVYAPGFS
jgi:hypothetical protein